MIKKETIFVSHSSTSDDDNYFASWLAVKLKSLGYKVWIDLQDLKGGQSFWPNIENLIRVDSIRFLSCVSKSYIEKARTPKTGVQKELSCASNIDIDEFIIPLRIDESDWRDLPIHINELNGIDFLNNWAVGFNELLDLFTDDKIPQNQKTDDVLNFWYEAQKISSEIEDVKERYYTNWFKIQIPEKIFVHKINKAKIDNLSQLPFPFYQDKDLLISFFDDRVIKNSISINKTYQFNFQEFIDNHRINLTNRTKLIDPRYKTISLLNKVLEVLMNRKEIFEYEYSNKTAYFFDSDEKRISLKHLNKTSKSIRGKSGDYFWFYGISSNVALNPFPHYKISHHVIFKDQDGQTVDKDLQHSLRRSTCNNWFNKDWLDRLLAWFTKLSCENERISAHVDLDKVVSINSTPHEILSPVGYQEPEKK